VFERVLNLRHLGRPEEKLGGANDARDLFRIAETDDCPCNCWVFQGPRNRYFPWRASEFVSDRAQGLNSRDDPYLALRLTLGLQRPDLIRRYWKGVLWSLSCFAASRGGVPVNILKTYIERQKAPL
jgi:REP element-mobilizing transposase RayT